MTEILKGELNPSKRYTNDFWNTQKIMEMFHYRTDAEFIKTIKVVNVEIIFKKGR